MNAYKNKGLFWRGALALALGLGLSACPFEDGTEVCATYACINAARLTGAVEVPEATQNVRVEYCSEVNCVKGTVDLRAAASKWACVGAGTGLDDDVCFTRAADGKLDVRATLTRPDDGTLPPNGERYTLTITEIETDTTLIQEVRQANYETTRRDNCHWCWKADMSL